jgi:NAD(P)-dependent dehydrogenase (short-subunit alcohol dehydrogenase family)
VERDSEYFGGKVAIVTGAGSGIGAALARALRARGAVVVATDIHPAAGIDRELDVRDRVAVATCVDTVVAEHGRLDLLFNNAGIGPGGPTVDVPAATWDQTLAVNLGGVVNGVLAAWPVFVAQGHGQLVNTASGAGLAAPPMVAAYAASKFGVVGLTQSLRAEGAGLGIKVNALCPGAVDTPILDAPGPSLTGREVMRLVGLHPVPADRVAAGALRGVARDRGVIVVPPSTAAGWLLNRVSPRLGDAMGRVVARRLRGGIASRSPR